MKFNYKAVLSFMALTFIVISACDDFIDVADPNRLDVETFYNTDEDASQALFATYDILQWHQNNWGWASPILVKTLPSDEGTGGGSDPSDQLPYQNLDDMNFDAANTAVYALWSIQYWGIYRANLVINNVEASTPIRERYIAEAKALRAYFYLELVTAFGDVPLILDELTPDQYQQTRVAASEIYDQIEMDLTEAAAVLPVKSAYDASDRFRVSRGTAQSLLGRAHLFQEEWAEAASALDQVINSGEYGLEADFGAVFSEAAELGTESIFEAVFIETFGYDWGGNGFAWGQRAESNIHIQLMGPREGEFTLTDSMVVGWGFNQPTQKMYDAFTAADLRRQHTVWSEQELIDAGGSATGNAYDYEGYIRRKYGSFNSESDGDVGQLNYGTNWRLMRYADVLLMAAEAHFNNSGSATALGYINQVRNRAGLADLTTLTLNDIVTERQLELAFEGHRYLDLIRWGLATQELDGFQAGKHELFPIPQDEVLAGGLSQNPNY